MTLRFYFDEDSMNRALIRALQDRGIDVENAIDAGQEAKSDENQLEFATAQNRVLFSFNIGDYHRLHRLWLAERRGHAGIVLCRQHRMLRCEIGWSS